MIWRALGCPRRPRGGRLEGDRRTIPSLKGVPRIPLATPDPAPVPFVVPDCRRPGQAMAPLPLKVPAEAAALLQAAADRLGTSRTALGRALLMKGLAQLEAGTTRAA